MDRILGLHGQLLVLSLHLLLLVRSLSAQLAWIEHLNLVLELNLGLWISHRPKVLLVLELLLLLYGQLHHVGMCLLLCHPLSGLHIRRINLRRRLNWLLFH